MSKKKRPSPLLPPTRTKAVHVSSPARKPTPVLTTLNVPGTAFSLLLSTSLLASGRSGLRPSLVQGLRPRNAPSTPAYPTVLLSLLTPLQSLLASGRSGLRPSLVQGLRLRNAPSTPAYPTVLPPPHHRAYPTVLTLPRAISSPLTTAVPPKSVTNPISQSVDSRVSSTYTEHTSLPLTCNATGRQNRECISEWAIGFSDALA